MKIFFPSRVEESGLTPTAIHAALIDRGEAWNSWSLVEIGKSGGGKPETGRQGSVGRAYPE